MAATAPTIISRLGWGANPLDTPAGYMPIPSDEVWLHHSAGEQFGAAGMRMLQQFTLHRQDEHYVDLEYTFVVDHADCAIYESRGVGHDTGATYMHNGVSHAICVMGNFQIDDPSEALLNTLANLVAWGYQQGWWKQCAFTGGHRDASHNSTACPGNKLEAQIPEVNRRALLIYAGGIKPPTFPAPIVKATHMPNLVLPPIVSDYSPPSGGTLLLGNDGGVFAFGTAYHGSPAQLKIPLEPGVTWSVIRAPYKVGQPGGDYRAAGGNHYTCVKSNGARFAF